ncbi:MAG: J domain-containing protein [Deltaproteobacteria bacterium]|nr:J domain-containing protein [Deltaproteobacteria bacterium]
MDIKSCYEILDLKPGASADEVKQAYKDLVNIWHPDRVSHNARLKQKAEEKLKQINGAYEALLSYLYTRPEGITGLERRQQPRPGEGPKYAEASADRDETAQPEAPERTPTGVLSAVWSRISDLLRSLGESAALPGSGTAPYSRGSPQRLGRNSRMGAGRPMGRRGPMGRGMRRGKGMGRGRGR